MTELILASLAFVGAHMLMSHGNIRRSLVARLGLWPHRGLYSLVSFITFGWMIWAYMQAPGDVLFIPHMSLRHMPMTLMLLACFFLVSGYTIINPSGVGMEGRGAPGHIPGILKITRAPIMWGTALFAFSHLLANGDAAAWIFFGALTLLAIGGGWHLDQRKTKEARPEWLALRKESSFFPFSAVLSGRAKLKISDLGWWRLVLTLVLYAALMAAHSAVIGVTPMPLPS